MVIFTFRSDNWREIAIVLKQLRDLATRKHKFLLQLDQSIATHTHRATSILRQDFECAVCSECA